MQPHDTTNDIPYGYCQCGCGQKTSIAKRSDARHGHVKGQPVKYVHQHSKRSRSYPTIEDKFWACCGKREGDACWEWTGARTANNYGNMRYQSRNHFAHRVSWTIHYGPIPDGMNVLHRCDNPPCCNPHHLFLGTQADNVEDMVAKGRRR